jgi:hypothetical protein
MNYVIDIIKKRPHPEERLKGASRRMYEAASIQPDTAGEWRPVSIAA